MIDSAGAPLWASSPAEDRVSVVIPVLNESRRIQSVVRLARESPCVGEVLVVDDGSIDDTPDPARAAGGSEGSHG
jgi:glycosyltransferase involved in cell wall biosynthesis